MKKNNVTCLIPMRHNSERVPGKNYRTLGDKFLFEHILKSVLEVNAINEVIINTDSQVIKDIIEESYKNRVKIIERPHDLISGEIPMNKIIENDLDIVSNEIILQTHSTNPFLSATSIENAIKVFLEDGKHDSLFSVSSIQSRFYDHNKKPINHNPKILLRTQDLDPIYEENSCIYLFTKKSFHETGNRIGEKPILFKTNLFESLDIDDEMDFQIAESLVKKQSE